MTEKKLDPRVRKTRASLRDALIQLMESKEYGQITIQDIAELAAVNRATFYAHYTDKDDLLEKTVDDMLSSLFGDASKFFSVRKDSEELQHYIALHIFEHVGRYDRFFHVMLIKKGMPNFIEHLKEFFTRFYAHTIQETNVAEEKLSVSKEIVISYIASAYIGTISWWLKNEMPYPAEEMARQMIILNTKGPIQLLRNTKDK